MSLAENGFEVTLVINDYVEDEEKNGIRILSTKDKPQNKILRVLSSKKKLLLKALAVNADIYHIHDPELLVLGNKLKKNGKIVIFDSHEDVPLQIYEKEWIPTPLKGIVSKIYAKYENHSIKKYDAIITVTPHLVERFIKINPKTVLITNYPRVDKNENIIRKPEGYICFTGGIDESWNHDKILSALEETESVKYLLAGRADEDYLNKIMKYPAWDKVHYIGLVPHNEVKAIHSKSFAGMALNYSLQAMKFGTLGNTKLFEYMEAKLPVICSNYDIWEQIVDRNQCGICINPQNISDIINAIKYLQNNPEDAAMMGENGRRLVLEKYNWEIEEEKLIRLYLGLNVSYCGAES